MRTRNIIIVLAVVAVLAVLAIILFPKLTSQPRVARPDYWPTEAWRTAALEEEGLDSGKVAEGLLAIQERGSAIDSLMVIRHGKMILDAAFYPYDSAELHDLASVTKSFMTTLIGIAAGQEKLDLNAPVLSFFPERAVANLDERKQNMTVRHLTQMRNGMASGCQTGDHATLAEMMAAPDWVQHTLDRKMVNEPGTQWCYDSPGMHLLSAILQKATGQTALEFAQENLFEPLGITEVHWPSDPQGITRGWGDLHLKPADAARLGYLWLSGGEWSGEQIVPEDWVKESIQPHSDLGGGDGYGSGWWLWDSGYGAAGRGGQSIKVEPGLAVLVVTTGRGFDYDTEIDQHLVGAVVDLSHELPENPAGEAALAEALAALSKPDEPQPVPPLPELAGEISGKSYLLEPNEALLTTMKIDFDGSNPATLSVKYAGSDEWLASPVGMDGIYRQGAEADRRRGYWADPQTFVIEIKDVDEYTIRARFEGDRVVLESPEYGVKIEGQIQ